MPSSGPRSPAAPRASRASPVAGGMAQATRLHRAGRLAEAIAAYRQVIKLAPKTVEAHNNLAAALRAAGRPREAVASYRRAVKLRPDYAIAQANLGALLAELGKIDEGLEHLANATLLAADDLAPRERLLAVLAPLAPARAGPQLRRALERLAADPGVDLQRLAHPGAALLRGQTPVATLLQRLADDPESPTAGILPSGLYAALTAPLPLALLCDALLADAAVERLLTALRRLWLAQACGAETGALPPPGLLAAVALQAANGEWVWPESDGERQQLALLAGRLAARGEIAAVDEQLLAFALYRPLAELPEAQTAALRALCAELPEGPARDLLIRHLEEPPAEAELAAALPRLTPIADTTSQRVRAQYETHAYPRWRRLGRRAARPLAAVLGGLLPGAPLGLPPAEAPRVLVAGCGTGRHALATATRYTGARVLAVDLSLAALGFAARQARDLGIDGIEFAQADILGLAGLEQRFDLVECSGTLHHMADPEAGWRVLRGLLEPRGLMRIALYSERGRAGVVAARDLIAQQRQSPNVEGIRAARAALRALPADSPVHPLTESADFFSLSGCRDMLFHVQEVRFDLPRIVRALDALELEFLGFELPSESIRRAFVRRFPDPAAQRDLVAWDAFETDHPTAFSAMYQFWCRARN